MKKIKVIIAMLGLDQHEVGAIAISRLLREHGIEVVYMGRFNTPAGIVTIGGIGLSKKVRLSMCDTENSMTRVPS